MLDKCIVNITEQIIESNTLDICSRHRNVFVTIIYLNFVNKIPYHINESISQF